MPDGNSCGYYVCWHAEAWLFNDRNLILDPINLVKEKRRVLWHINQLYGMDNVPYQPRNMPPNNGRSNTPNNVHTGQAKILPIVQIDAPSIEAPSHSKQTIGAGTAVEQVNGEKDLLIGSDLGTNTDDEYDPSKNATEKKRIKNKRDNMNNEEKEISKKKDSDRKKKVRDNLNDDEKEISKKKDSDRKKKTKDRLNNGEIELIEIFKQEISGMPNVICDVCKRRCYNMQTVCRNASKCSRYAQSYLPSNLKEKEKLTLCIRCMRHLTNKNKMLHPAKAYWNNLDPGKIPEEISCLTSVESD